MNSAKPPLVLGIETSCDDTACALVDGAGRVVASVVSSQLAAHRPYGGVVPEIASREHLANWPRVSEAAFEAARVALEGAEVELRDVDVVAATRGPGLVGSLLVGLSLGKAIAYALERPFHAVHHLEAHLYSPFLRAPERTDAPSPPAEEVPDAFTGLVVSGGHTTLFQVRDGRIDTVAETRDDAMGECFDKVGKRLRIPYPQGPQVDALAETGDADRRPFAVPRCGDSLDFSYSGLKSQALLEIERLERNGVATAPGEADPPFPQQVLDLLAGFRRAATGQLLDRVARLHREHPVRTLAVSGGAAANRLLRRDLATWAEAEEVDLRLVPLTYSGDNAAMIAYAALLRERQGRRDDPLHAEAASRIAI